MPTGARLKISIQAFAVLTTAAAAVALFVVAEHKPVDAATLLVTVSQLRSQCSEAHVLLQRGAAGDATDLFVRWHFEQLRQKVEGARDQLDGMHAESAIVDDAKAAAQLAAALTDALGAAGQLRATSAATMRLASLEARISALERALKARTR